LWFVVDFMQAGFMAILFDTQRAMAYGTHLLQAVVFAAGFAL
jgi:hypothetical protein